MDEKESQEEQGASKHHPVVLQDAEGRNLREQQGDEQARPPKPRRKRRSIEVWFAGAIALFTLIQAITSYLQWKAIKEGLRATERPWIIVKTVRAFEIVPERPIVVAIILSNAGKSPATKIALKGSSIGLPKGIPFPDNPSYLPPLPNPSTGIIGPGQEILFPIPLQSFSQKVADDINNGRFILYVYGEILYRDQFSSEHFLKFCFEFDPPTKNIAISRTHNDAN